MLKQLKKAKKAANRNNTLPVFDNAQINDGFLTVGDHNLFYSFYNDKLEGLNIAVDFNQLLKVFEKLKNTEFELIQSDGYLTVKTPKGNLNLPASNIFDFHGELLKTDPKLIGQIKTEHLPLIKKSILYQSDDELRPSMCHTLLDKAGFIVASDAHKLCKYPTEPATKENILISKKTCNLLDFHCNVYEYENYLFFQSENEAIYQRKEQSNYPNWRHICPQNFNQSASIAADELLERLELALITGNKDSELVRFDFTKDKTIISSKDIDFNTSFESEINATFEGEPLSIGLKNKYMREIIKTEKLNKIEIYFTSESGIMEINSDILLMPMMLNN